MVFSVDNVALDEPVKVCGMSRFNLDNTLEYTRLYGLFIWNVVEL